MKKLQELLTMPTIAYFSGFSGVEIKDVEYGIEDYIICVSGAWGSIKTAHRVKIYYNTSGAPYFKLYGVRIHLYECIREDVGTRCIGKYRI